MPDLWLDVDAALSEVPVNILPLIDDTDFKTREEAVAYNATGIELIFHFTTTAGVTTATVVTPTTGGLHDWAHQDGGMYTIEIPTASGDINNTVEGFGWFTGVADGVLPWRGPVIGFRAAGLNNVLIDSAYSATRGLAGTALPDAVADASGGVPISDAGGLDLDTKLANTNEITAVRMAALTDWINGGRLDLILDIIAADVVNIDGSAMIGTNNAALASVCTEARLAELAAANLPTDIAAIKSETALIVADTGTDGVVVAAASKTGYALSAAGVQAIWDALTSALTAAGSIGKKLADWVIATAPTAAIVADAVWDEALAAHVASGSTGAKLNSAFGLIGPGGVSVTLTIENSSGDPVAFADVWITTDSAGATVIAGTLQTNSSGQVTFMLEDGTTYYRWAQKDGYDFTNPQSFAVAS